MGAGSRLEDWSRQRIEELGRLSGTSKRVVASARFVFMPLALAFLAYVTWSSRDLLGDVISGATIAGLAFATLLWSLLHINAPLFDRLILLGLGHDASYTVLCRIYLARLPTKYLPGGIWHNVTRLLDLSQASVPRRLLTTLAILQVSVPACTAFVIGGSLVYMTRGTTRWGVIGAAAATAGTLILLATPWVLNRSVLRGKGALSGQAYVGGIAVTAVTWMVASGAFYSYVSAYPLLTTDTTFFDVAGAYLVSWGTGFISIFTPQGLGVFEATSAGLLSSSADFQVMVAIVAGFRIVVLASDALTWLTFYVGQKLLLTSAE